MRYLLTTLLGLIGAVMPAPGFACSLIGDYRVPTNFEMVQKADVIVIVRVESGPEQWAMGGAPSVVHVQPVSFLKGSADAQELSIEGLIAWEGRAVTPIPTALAEVHYSASFGSCNRVLFPRGGLVLAMYRRVNGKLVPSDEPYARFAEDVSGMDDLWVRTVQRYLALLAGNPRTLNRRATAERAALMLRPDMESRAVALDLGAYLALKRPLRWVPRWNIWINDPAQVTVAAPLTASDESLITLDCSAARGPAIYWSKAGRGPLALRVDGQVFETRPGAPLHGADDATTGDFLAPEALLAALGKTWEPVTVLSGGKPVRQGAPADAMFRWAQRCRAARG